MENGQPKLFSMLCPNCGKMIFAGKHYCESCGWKRGELATPKKENIEQGRFSTKSKILIGLSGMIGIAIVMGLMMNFFYSKEQREIAPISKDNVDVEIKKSEKPVELLANAKKLINENNSSAAIENLKKIIENLEKIREDKSPEYSEAQNLLKQEGLREAKKILKEKPKDTPYDNSETYLWEAEKNLKFIEKGDKEYPEAKNLLKQINARQKILLEQADAETEKSMASTRKDYAKELESQLLNNSKMDTIITTSGKNNTTLKLQYILVSRVFVNELTKDGKLQNTWRSMGFKTIIFTNGYNETWTINLKK